MMPPTDRTEARSGLDLIARDARDDEELAEDLAIAEWALDEYGKKGADGTVSYVVVEASYIINGRDTERALRSARFFAEFTGRRCYAAVAGYRLDDRVRQHVDSGEVFWYQLEPES